MKIAAIIENNINTGGGFTMSVEILLMIQNIAKRNKFVFIVLNYVKEVWTDMRPKSLREEMDNKALMN